MALEPMAQRMPQCGQWQSPNLPTSRHYLTSFCVLQKFQLLRLGVLQEIDQTIAKWTAQYRAELNNIKNLLAMPSQKTRSEAWQKASSSFLLIAGYPL